MFAFFVPSLALNPRLRRATEQSHMKLHSPHTDVVMHVVFHGDEGGAYCVQMRLPLYSQDVCVR